jgi:adenylate cyclase
MGNFVRGPQVKRLLSYLTRLTPFRLSMLVTAAILSAVLVEPSFLNIIEMKALDAKFKTRGARVGYEKVAIIAIDEKSVQELGRWPWPRWTAAELLNQLAKAEARAVAFDIVYSEPDQNSELVKLRELRQTFKKLGLDNVPKFKELPAEYALAATNEVQALASGASRFYEELKRSEEHANSDEALGTAIANFRDQTILGYYFYGSTRDLAEGTHVRRTDELIAASRVGQVLTVGGVPDTETLEMEAVVANIEVIGTNTDHYGHFYMLPDDADGVIRWNHLVLRFEDGYYPSLGLKAASVALNQPILIKVEHGMVHEVRVGNIRIPTDGGGRLLVNYAGPLKTEDGLETFKVYSFVDIMKGRVPAEELRDKIFMVGPTAVGIYDLRNTPFDTAYPGVGIHVNVLENILTQNFVQKPGWMKIFDIGIVVLLGIVLGLLLGRLRSFAGAFATVVLALSYYIFTQYAFAEWGIWLSTVYPQLEIISVFGVILTYKYMTEERQARQIKGAFQSYVTPSVVNQVLLDPSKLKLGGETRELTVLFSDIRGFTTISEQLNSEQLVDLLNAYLSSMTDLVFDFDGTLDKYMGDAVMAIWGAPVVQGDHAKRACFAAIEMMRVLEQELKPRWARDGLKSIPAGLIPVMDIGIGLNTGPMSVGNMGSTQRFDYTVMGDNVNLGSRLEGINKPYGTNIIISEWTRSHVGASIITRELDAVRVKGKNEPVRIYELVGKAGAVDDATLEKIALFEKGLGYYRQADWDRADEMWLNLIKRFPDDKTAAIFLKRVAAFRKDPVSAGWDGVYEMTTK